MECQIHCTLAPHFMLPVYTCCSHARLRRLTGSGGESSELSDMGFFVQRIRGIREARTGRAVVNDASSTRKGLAENNNTPCSDVDTRVHYLFSFKHLFVTPYKHMLSNHTTTLRHVMMLHPDTSHHSTGSSHHSRRATPSCHRRHRGTRATLNRPRTPEPRLLGQERELRTRGGAQQHVRVVPAAGPLCSILDVLYYTVLYYFVPYHSESYHIISWASERGVIAFQ